MIISFPNKSKIELISNNKVMRLSLYAKDENKLIINTVDLNQKNLELMAQEINKFLQLLTINKEKENEIK